MTRARSRCGTVRGNAGADLLALDARRLAVLCVGGGANDLREHAERRARAHRIAARRPHLVSAAAMAERAQELVAEAGLADAGGRGDEHGAGNVVRDALREDALEHDDLALAADARRGLAEQHAAGVDGRLLADELEPSVARRARDEARIEETRRHLVDVDRLLAAGRGRRLEFAALILLQHPHGAIDRVADRNAVLDHGASRREDHRYVRRGRTHRQHAARGAGRLVRRRVTAGERDDDHPARERLEVRARTARSRRGAGSTGISTPATCRRSSSTLRCRCTRLPRPRRR